MTAARIPALVLITSLSLFMVGAPLTATAADERQPGQDDSTSTRPERQIPELDLNRTRLNFGSVEGGSQTGAQRFLINNSGDGTIDWTAQGSEAWISASPGAGAGSHFVEVTIDPSGLSTGSYTGAVIVSDPAAGNSPQTVDVYFVVYNPGSTGPPFGTFETPIDSATVSGAIPVTGWALDDIGVASVGIFFQEGSNTVFIGNAIFVDGARPDVEAAYPDLPRNFEAGWGYMLLTNGLPGGGNGTFTLLAIATDMEGNTVTLGTKTITCDNASAVKPFGTIDTPAQGGEASGSSYRVQGWALTPQPNTIPTDGSTITLYIDGINQGHPTYNLYRGDVEAMFPGYTNSSGAGFYWDLDTTAYENGTHTIYASVTDDAGNSEGIGSRYFTINNPGAPVPVELISFVID
ncbi:MAG: hypothetical protein DRJ65_13475 [Acidobacteria bacterium]|nr:MAG: hypothetical protein DRJ65_13475 [Acidobacteriota bacterium]